MFGFISFIAECLNIYNNEPTTIKGLHKISTAWSLSVMISKFFTKTQLSETEIKEFELRNILWKDYCTRNMPSNHPILLIASNDVKYIFETLSLLREAHEEMFEDNFEDVKQYPGTFATETRL